MIRGSNTAKFNQCWTKAGLGMERDGAGMNQGWIRVKARDGTGMEQGRNRDGADMKQEWSWIGHELDQRSMKD